MVEDGVEAGDVLDIWDLFETDVKNGYRGGIVAVRGIFSVLGPRVRATEANLQWRKVF
jgi:hypothetical protein